MNLQNTTIYTKNIHHLGDNIFCCILFCKIKEYIEQNNILIIHYCLTEHINQITEFINSKNIKIVSIEELSQLSNNIKVYDLWMGSSDYEYNYYYEYINSPDNINLEYDMFLCKFYNNILNILNIPIEINKFTFDGKDLPDIAQNINNKTNNKYNNIDVLFINGTPLSGQFTYNLEEWNNVIKLFSEKYNVVTTQKVDGVKCTREDNLSAKDISAISTNVKKIIAIDSGVSIGLYNDITLNNVEMIYYLCSTGVCMCSFPKFIHATNLNEILFLLNSDKKIETMQNIENNYNYNVINILIYLIGLTSCLLYYNKYKKWFYKK